MGKLIYTYWDCRYCGTKSIRGDYRECPNCGHPRDNNITFYFNSKNVTYVAEEKAKIVSKNPDWVCSFCDCLNSDDDLNCKSCGASKVASELNYFENQKKREEKTQETSPQIEKEASYSSTSPQHPYSSFETASSTISTQGQNQKGTSSTSTSLGKRLILFTLICLLVAGIVYLVIPKTQVLTVKEVSWEYTIVIEELKTFNESDWHIPSGARLKNTREELHHYDNVLDHYETKTKQVQKQRLTGYEDYVSGYRDLGNGYAEEIISKRPIYETYYDTETYDEPVYRKEPVYQIKYYYEIDRWVPQRNITTSGSDKNPYWGEISLSSNERVGSKEESYFIRGVSEKGKEYHFAVSHEDFKTIIIGNSYEFEIGMSKGSIVQK